MTDELDDSEILFLELNRSIVNLYKMCFEEMGYDLGPTINNVEYHNYLYSDPLYIYNSKSDGPKEYSDNETLFGKKYWESEFVISEYQISLDVLPTDILSFIRLMNDCFPNIVKDNNKLSYAWAAFQALVKYGEYVGFNMSNSVAILMVFAQMIFESYFFTYKGEIGKGGGRHGAYYGRGPLQITWKDNYVAIQNEWFPKIGINADIVNDPDILIKNIDIGCAASVGWFTLKGNEKAISAANWGDVTALSKAINGGYNGLAKRRAITKKLFDAFKIKK